MHSKQALFLHWGPGSNTSVERAWFGESLPIRWWDQPTTFADPAKALEEIVQAARLELTRLSDSATEPVPIVAHSFGGKIARELVRLSSERISEIVLLNCGFSPIHNIIRLGEHLGLRRKAEVALSELGPKTFWPLVQEILSKDFFSAYWKCPEALTRYLDVSSGPPLNFDAFTAIVNCLLTSTDTPMEIQEANRIPVRALFGTADPLQDLEEEVRSWKQVFPNSEFQFVETGHFIQFELSPSLWLPSRL